MDTIMIISLALSLIAVALNLWLMWSRERLAQRVTWSEGDYAFAFECLWEFARAELLAGGRGKHYAYCVTDNGVLLRFDAVYIYLALVTRMNRLWDAIASARRLRRDAFAISLDEIDLGDGKGHFTCIYYGGRECFIDTLIPVPLLHPHNGTWTTAEEFKKAIIDAQAKSAKGGTRHDDVKDDFECHEG